MPNQLARLLFFLAIIILKSCSVSERSQESYASDDIVTEAKLESAPPEPRAEMKMEKADKDSKKPTSSSWMRSSALANTPTIFVGDNEQLQLKASQIAVKVDGFRARVLIDCSFFNDRGWNLEGTFKMKLPQGATPYYFAFGESVIIDKKKKDSVDFVEYEEMNLSPQVIEKDRETMWAEPKVARVVEKEKAAFAYGQTVRRQIDPALAEWAGADVFNCRVFPLQSNRMHRVVIGYDVSLQAIQNDIFLQFDVPQVDCPLQLDFDIADNAGLQSQISPEQTVTNRKGRKYFSVSGSETKMVEIRYKNQNTLAITSNADDSLGQYFSARMTPDLPATQSAPYSSDAVLALDISLSSNPDKFNVWLKMAEALLANNPNSIKTFNVLLFNVEAFWWKETSVANSAQNRAEFLEYAQSLLLEGASDLALALSEISKKQNNKTNVFLLSDGSANWGKHNIFGIASNLSSGQRLYAFNSGMSGTSMETLNHLSSLNGGAVFSVTGEDEIANASTAFLKQPWKIESLSVDGTSDIIIKGNPQYVYPSQKIEFAGRGSISDKSNIKLAVSQNGTTKTISVPVETALHSELAARSYGQIATELLETFGYATEKESAAYAKHFSVPGKSCSLLMLESEEDYRQFNIKASEDAFVVKQLSVNSILNRVQNEIASLLSSAKEQFKQWVNRLPKLSGIELDLPASFEIVMNSLNETDFTVTPKNLQCKHRQITDVPKEYTEVLLMNLLPYDAIESEAQRRAEKWGAADALKALSSLVEKNPGNSVLIRDLAYSAMQWDLNEQAYYLCQPVLQARPYEPQTYMAAAKALDKIGKNELSLLFYEIAIGANWDERFGEFHKIASLSYLNFLRRKTEQLKGAAREFAEARHESLKNILNTESLDLVIVLEWNTDNTDVDLHVIEPSGEECFYSHRKTKSGGTITQDVTTGYGPEMYTIENAKKGIYEVKVKYFSSDQNRLSTRTKVHTTIYRHWGTDEEQAESTIVPLADNKEMHKVQEVYMK